MLSEKLNRKLAKRLGVFSVGLGFLEMALPKKIANALGLKSQDKLLRGFGLRELLNGAALLKARNPLPWLWTRVAGDGMDLAALGAGLLKDKSKKKYIAGAALAVIGIAALDTLCASHLSKRAKYRYWKA